jgi:hypothetical protein
VGLYAHAIRRGGRETMLDEAAAAALGSGTLEG